MPEYRELQAAYLVVSRFINDHTPHQLKIEHIWADFTKDECHHPPLTTSISPGHVQLLDHRARHIFRGNLNDRSPLWPKPTIFPFFGPYLRESGLMLVDVVLNPRHVILNMGTLWIQVQLLQHTFPQIYTKNAWKCSIRAVPWQERGVKIGIAFDFGAHILAFTTNDFLFKISYAKSLSLLPPRQIEPTTDAERWVGRLLQWMDKMENSMSTVCVCNLLRSEGHIWGGVGVYTAPELCVMAGFSPFLTFEEVFGNPSRTARIVAAVFTFSHRSPEILRELLGPRFIDKYTLAVTPKEKLRYSRFLKVFGKDWVSISKRMSHMLFDFLVVLAEKLIAGETWFREPGVLFDVFEPTMIEVGLKLFLGSLGPLIFGQSKWKDLCPSAGSLPESTAGQMIYTYFECKGLLNEHTHLELSKYSLLFLSPKEATSHRCQTYVYQQKKKIWSSVPFYGFNSAYIKKFGKKAGKVIEFSNPQSSFVPITGAKRDELLIKNVYAESARYAVGPLDFVGTVSVVAHGHSRVPAYCMHDPSLTPFLRYRHHVGKVRRKYVRPGHKPLPIKDKQVKKLKEEARKASLGKRKCPVVLRKFVDYKLANGQSLY
ncbi:hypothetical protein M422DRAFT_785446 [Sphaerobolus stellatus SS14]|uniref:Uncharacterized protein n=1 Tax=Sphaerobolus stellatus (strain SS14) TaxID=990650 RepID=A0A0C9T9H6_SPHS4|nr:hypothetical protein M422DRAFT_785446 [Sphaerobolus stellatus SS14]